MYIYGSNEFISWIFVAIVKELIVSFSCESVWNSVGT